MRAAPIVVVAAAAAVVASAIGARAAGRTARSPQEAPVPAPATAPPAKADAPAAAAAVPPPARLSRDVRLAREKASLEQEIALTEAFGRVDEFRDGLHELAKRATAAAPDAESWVQVADGWLPMMAIEHWLQWHLPTTEGAAPLALAVELQNHPFPAIVDFADQLRAHEVDFLMVVFPSRLQLYPELVLPAIGELPAEKFRGMVNATERFLLALNERGVETVNLAPAFIEQRRVAAPEGQNGELYLARNKHWSPRAAELAAKVVAGRLREMEWFADGPAVEGRDFEIAPKTARFVAVAGGQSPDHSPELLGIDQVIPLTKVINPKDARRSPVVVLSDSFAKFFVEAGTNSSFIDHLIRFTGHPIDAITPMGGGELRCREVLAQRGDGLRGKRVVIWLLQEDNLRPVPGFRKVKLFE